MVSSTAATMIPFQRLKTPARIVKMVWLLGGQREGRGGGVGPGMRT